MERTNAQVAARDAAFARTLRIVEEVTGSDVADEDAALIEWLKAAKQAARAARADLEEEERFAQSREDSWKRLSTNGGG